MLKKCCSALLAFCILLTASGCGGPKPALDTETPAPEVTSEESTPASPAPEVSPVPDPDLSQRERNWIADLNYLRRHYKQFHADPFYYCSEEEFDFKINQLSAKVGELSDNDIAFEIAAIIAGMGDIHTAVSLPESVFEAFFPVDLVCFGDKLYLAAYLEGYDQYEPYLLQEIVAVNGVDVSYLQKKLYALISPDNIWCSKEVFSRYYAIYPAFYDWAGCDYTEGYTFQILNENREVESVEVPVLSWEDFDEDVSWVRAEGLYALHYLKGGNWAEYFEEEKGGYIYMSFTEMLSLGEAFYRELFETTAELIKAHPDCGKLVIDLRSHPGGMEYSLQFIRQYAELLKAPSIEHTYVLTGGCTTSGAIMCMEIFKDSLNAVTVGEPTGQFTSFFSRRTIAIPQIVLPLSQLSLSIGDEWSVGEHPENELYDENGRLYEWENTVLPDVFVSQNMEDIRRGKDSVIQWILEQR